MKYTRFMLGLTVGLVLGIITTHRPVKDYEILYNQVQQDLDNCIQHNIAKSWEGK